MFERIARRLCMDDDVDPDSELHGAPAWQSYTHLIGSVIDELLLPTDQMLEAGMRAAAAYQALERKFKEEHGGQPPTTNTADFVEAYKAMLLVASNRDPEAYYARLKPPGAS